MSATTTSFAYAVGRIRVMESRLLDRGQLDRMIEAPSREEALKVLSETVYAGCVAELACIHDFEEMLREELNHALTEVRRMSPWPELVDLLTLRYDLHNLKVLFKDKYLGSRAEILFPSGALPPDRLRAAVTEEDFRDLAPAVRTAAERVVEEFAASRDPQLIDLHLDRALFDELLVSGRAARSSFLEGLFRRQADLANLRAFIRVKRMGRGRNFLKKVLFSHGAVDPDLYLAVLDEPLEALITRLAMSDYAAVAAEGVREWQERGDAARLEKRCDDFITAYLERGKRSPFGAEPLIGYLWGKEIEIKNIRLILVGKINRLPVEAIRERVRHVYA